MLGTTALPATVCRRSRLTDRRHFTECTSPVGGHLGCFQDCAVAANTTINEVLGTPGQLWVSPLTTTEAPPPQRSPPCLPQPERPGPELLRPHHKGPPRPRVSVTQLRVDSVCQTIPAHPSCGTISPRGRGGTGAARLQCAGLGDIPRSPGFPRMQAGPREHPQGRPCGRGGGRGRPGPGRPPGGPNVGRGSWQRPRRLPVAGEAAAWPRAPLPGRPRFTCLACVRCTHSWGLEGFPRSPAVSGRPPASPLRATSGE